MKLNHKIIAAILAGTMLSPVAFARTQPSAMRAPTSHVQVATAKKPAKKAGRMTKSQKFTQKSETQKSEKSGKKVKRSRRHANRAKARNRKPIA